MYVWIHNWTKTKDEIKEKTITNTHFATHKTAPQLTSAPAQPKAAWDCSLVMIKCNQIHLLWSVWCYVKYSSCWFDAFITNFLQYLLRRRRMLRAMTLSIVLYLSQRAAAIQTNTKTTQLADACVCKCNNISICMVSHRVRLLLPLSFGELVHFIFIVSFVLSLVCPSVRSLDRSFVRSFVRHTDFVCLRVR